VIRTGLLIKIDVIDPQAAQHALPRFLTSPLTSSGRSLRRCQPRERIQQSFAAQR
jgi:hypothetical protein